MTYFLELFLVFRCCDIYFLLKKTRLIHCDSSKRICEKIKRKYFLFILMSRRVCAFMKEEKNFMHFSFPPFSCQMKLLEKRWGKDLMFFFCALLLRIMKTFPTQLLAIETNCFTHASKCLILWIFISLQKTANFK